MYNCLSVKPVVARNQ